MSLLNFFTSLSPSSNPPETEVPSGSPSIDVQSDILLIANQPAQDNRWYGRTAMKDLGNGIWILAYANSESHVGLLWSQIHFRFSNDYGETWTDENKYLDNSSISGVPIYPSGSVPGTDNTGPGEAWLVVCPNGDILCHTWDSQYNVSNNGTWQWRSTDGGKSWTAEGKIDFVGTAQDNRIFMTDDDFVYNGVIYTGAREYEADDSQVSSRSWFVKSEDSGITWELVSLLSSFTDKTNEYGMEYVGNNRIVACVREFVGPPAYYTKSDDFGQTWDALTDVSSLYDVWSRQRVKTRSHVKGKNNWWLDPVVICHGFVHVDGDIGQSHPRRIAVWISKDHGLTFDGPHYLKEQGYDGGYGDFLYNPLKDEYVTTQYYAPTSFFDGEIRQINWKLNWS